MNASTDRTTPNGQHRNKKNFPTLPTAPASIPPITEEALAQIGIKNPLTITTAQAAAYLSQIKGVPTAKSTLEVFRCRSTGPKYKKVGGRVYYHAAWLDEYAEGVPVVIFDPKRI